jgi:predicted amidohydrolase
MIIGALQLDVRKDDKPGNLDTVQRLVNNQVDLVVLPELFSTGYYFDSATKLKEISEEIPYGYTTGRLIKIAKAANCHIVGAIVEKEAGKLYITAVLTGPGGYIGKQRKRHLTDHETKYFTPGDSSEVFKVLGCKIGMIICFEGWFPESSRELTVKGAQIICHSMLTCQQKTMDIMRVRAIENKVFMVVANSISTEMLGYDSVTFRGDSRIIDYNGNILINAGKDEKLIWTQVDEKAASYKDLEDCRDLIQEIKKHGFYK